MSKFDSTRFVESFFAAVLGAGAYAILNEKTGLGSEHKKSIRSFQRALIVAVEYLDISEQTASQYMERISNLPQWQRLEYMKSALQPPLGPPNDKQTAIVIRDHALKSSDNWNTFIKAFGFDRPHPLDTAEKLVSTTVRKGAETFDQFQGAVHRNAEKIREERKIRIRRGWIETPIDIIKAIPKLINRFIEMILPF